MSAPPLQAVPRASEPPQGDPSLVAVDRALAELRRGRGIVVQEAAGRAWRLVAPLETAEEPLVAYLLAQAGSALVVTGERAAQLRVPCESDELLLLNLPAGLTATQMLELGRHWEADAWRDVLGAAPHASCADALAAAAVRLAKSAQLLPALLVSGVATGPAPASVLAVRVDQVE